MILRKRVIGSLLMTRQYPDHGTPATSAHAKRPPHERLRSSREIGKVEASTTWEVTRFIGTETNTLGIADDTLGTPKSTKSLHPVYGR